MAVRWGSKAGVVSRFESRLRYGFSAVALRLAPPLFRGGCRAPLPLDPLPPTASLDERRQAAEAIFDWIKVTGAEVDGVPIEDLTSYKAISPPYNVTLPPGNIFGFPAGEYGPTVSAGYYILLAPLSAGNHTIRFHFQFYYPPAGQVLNLDNIYHLTVLGD